MRFPESEYHLPFFDENGFVRKMCPKCGEYFWTQRSDLELCGESSASGCADYNFIGKPPTKKPYTLEEMREAFLSFFEKRGHTRIKPYPVVARWRDDVYFTNASIINFQPYVTEGIIPPPSNPLVISQPCLRFPDVDSVGLTFGRHLTIFEMGGHHAFNYPDKEVYWKDETVRFHHEFVTKELGVNSEDVTYKEGIWSGGGNAGPDLESIIQGLEVATLVFMKYKVINDEFLELPIRTVDTGYGIERFTWLSRGCPSGFEAVYGDLIDQIRQMAGIERFDEKLLARISKVSGRIQVTRTYSRAENFRRIAERLGFDEKEIASILSPVVDVFAVADHTKCLTFLLAEGVVPSNVQEGYLARLMIRRTLRLLKRLSIEDRILEIIDMQISRWSKDFPQLKEMRDEIFELIEIEREKYTRTIERGRDLIKKTIGDLRAKGFQEIPLEKMVELYDSHGLTPEVVLENAEAEGIKVRIPDNFYSYVAQRHVEAPRSLKGSTEVKIEELSRIFSDLPETRKLYYEDAYLTRFSAKVIGVHENVVVLDRTAFYPEGGGQPADKGYLEFNLSRARVVDVQKIGKHIAHFLEGAVPRIGDDVEGIIDEEYRRGLMRSHSATHIVMGAARRVLGQHVWQSGAQKEPDKGRLDISHPKRLTSDEIYRIELLANDVIMKNIPIEVFLLPREEAEKLFGFRLYQGGVVPGREIRVVKTGDWEVEACGGTHCKSTGEIGLIKIVHTERIQDGVERIVFSTGLSALKFTQEEESNLIKAANLLGVQKDSVAKTLEQTITEYRELRRDKERLTDRLAKLLAEKHLSAAEDISGLHLVSGILSSEDFDVDLAIRISSEIITLDQRAIVIFLLTDATNARLVAMVGREALKMGVKANEVVKEAAPELGGGGSGRLEFAQGGGKNVEGASKALEKAKMVVRRMILG
ncbi:MAG: alanine--tRNA ligase [Nitrososphaerota archaeon]|nr:alanine--tRNA ligase [Nitrososphaerota archaeon]